MALWDAPRRRLLLARDRLGVRPLFYTEHDGRLLFGSEIKSLLAYPGVRCELDPVALQQVFTCWSPVTPRSAFRDVWQIPPGHYALAEDGAIALRQWWAPDFTPEPPGARSVSDYEEELEALLVDAARIRLRADVPVGAYLSGGLDSSLTTALIRKHTGNRLETFSVAFENPQFDESAFQQRMAGFLGTEHHVVRCADADIGEVFPAVIWHTETPILRTAPAPLFLLSRLVHRHGLKVVVTGEGADEVLAGYDIFKEAAIRRFWARQPDSQVRPLLLQKLYPDIAALSTAGDAYLTAFFRRGLTETTAPEYSHALRWSNTGRLQRFLAEPAVPGDVANSVTRVAAGGLRRVAAAGASAISGDDGLSVAIPALVAGRPRGDGEFSGGSVSLPGLPRRGVRKPVAARIETARADREVAAAARRQPSVAT